MLYEEIQEKEAELETMISPWQKKIQFFKELKERLEKKQDKYLLKEFAWTKERYSPQNLHHFSKIVFLIFPLSPTVVKLYFHCCKRILTWNLSYKFQEKISRKRS